MVIKLWDQKRSPLDFEDFLSVLNSSTSVANCLQLWPRSARCEGSQERHRQGDRQPRHRVLLWDSLEMVPSI